MGETLFSSSESRHRSSSIVMSWPVEEKKKGYRRLAQFQHTLLRPSLSSLDRISLFVSSPLRFLSLSLFPIIVPRPCDRGFAGPGRINDHPCRLRGPCAHRRAPPPSHLTYISPRPLPAHQKLTFWTAWVVLSFRSRVRLITLFPSPSPSLAVSYLVVMGRYCPFWVKTPKHQFFQPAPLTQRFSSLSRSSSPSVSFLLYQLDSTTEAPCCCNSYRLPVSSRCTTQNKSPPPLHAHHAVARISRFSQRPLPKFQVPILF